MRGLYGFLCISRCKRVPEFMKRIALGSDHTGYELKEVIRLKAWADIHVFMDRNTRFRGLNWYSTFRLRIQRARTALCEGNDSRARGSKNTPGG